MKNDKPYTKEQEEHDIRVLMEGIQRRLARIEAECTAAASRYTVVFEKRESSWGARIIGTPGFATSGKTLEEISALIVQKISEHSGR